MVLMVQKKKTRRITTPDIQLKEKRIDNQKNLAYSGH